MPDNPRPHSDDCEVAWTIILHHDGRVVFDPCDGMGMVQAEVARSLLEWFCPGCPHPPEESAVEHVHPAS